MIRSVLDASALLALLYQEVGAERVAQAVTAGAAVSAVNLSEVVAKLSEAGMPAPAIQQALSPLDVETVVFATEAAYQTGLLRLPTRQVGLSLGDRACLALAQQLNLPILTADRSWEGLSLGVLIDVIR